MGVIINQTLKNTIYTYLGFGIGAINVLFLFTNFMTDEYYGLIGYLLSVANIMMPLLCFGVQNTLIKFFSFYADEDEKNKFTTLMFFLPIVIIIPVGIIGVVGYNTIVGFLSKENAIVSDYVWTIYLLAITMAYFEVFYAWSKAHMKSVYGNFLKEVFNRLATMLMLFLLFFKILTIHQFIVGIVLINLIRMIMMGLSAYWVKKPKFKFSLPSNTKSVMKYSLLIVLAGSIAVMLLDIDKVMIGQFKIISNVAFYNVAIFMAMVIVVPSRSMHQITYPLTAKLMNEKNMKDLAILYKKSSLTLYIIGGLIFLFIILNVDELYRILPEQYSGGVLVVLFISIAKLSENLAGNNNSIIFNSNYYRVVLLFGVLLVLLTIGLNIIFIPLWGITGAAAATLTAFLSYSILKIYFVWKKFQIHPFSKPTLYVSLILILFLGVFYFWNFSFHPIINIVLKSIIIGILYLFLIIKLNLSEDITSIFLKYTKLKNP